MTAFKAMLAGAILVSAWAISVFFFRYWRKTRDRLFGFFAAAFVLLGIERVSILAASNEVHSSVYLIRFCAFLVILLGVFDKNRDPGKP